MDAQHTLHTQMDENVLNMQFIFGHQHTHIQGEQAKGGKQRERGGGTRYTAPAQGPKGGVLDTHIGSDYCDKYELMFSFRSLILSISSKFHGASGLAQGLFAN